jgi:hypothetical protein
MRYSLHLESGDALTLRCSSMGQRCKCSGGAACPAR